ncbi:unnamed protein product (macronuclear) [Paramecium tetraurelia]|uniref:Phosphatidic acid phosphatase type 2/haloperoxidase domain-containing protein n=1 Tax=Paramecium tetraurelia TaxID=5888 RepID=A0EES0_PARTE|nr:uncharacterized protein GSPATT00026134001 [Paramecium tetraurelia]CAK93811.1 unnamed protein product [Paramecium tetraurelia]|eukprot:XP_001461184.1 hypothetical protein (macronuclear) [Paramecium tetraurelia strain d4-2]
MYKLIFSTLILLFLLVLDHFFGGLTYNISNEITKFLQIQFEYGKETGIFEYILLIFSTAGDAECTNVLTILIWLKAQNKIQIFKLITMNAIAAAFGNLIKMVMTQPRPFYLDPQIKLDFCYTGYGDPSGHSLRSFVFYAILIETIVLKKYNHSENSILLDSEKQIYDQKEISNSELYNSIYENQYISYSKYKMFIATFAFLIGIGRLYFGVHFLNQIVIGWIIGGYILYIYYYCGLEKMIQKAFSNSLLLNQYRYLKILLVSLIVFALAFLLYFERHYEQSLIDMKQQWKQNILKQPLCTRGGGYNPKTKFETHDISGFSILFFPCYLLAFYSKQQMLIKIESDQILTQIGQNIQYLLTYIAMYWIQSFEKKATSRIGGPSETKRLLCKIFFAQFHYIKISILFLMIIPLGLRLAESFIKRQQFSRISQVDQSETEMV